MNISPKQLSSLAQESEQSALIDWASLDIDRDQLYNLMSLTVIEQMENLESDEMRMYVSMASMTHLIVENFVLNKLLLLK